MTFIYTLADPRNDTVRYVGKTDDPVYRAKTHLRREHSKKGRWVQGLLSHGFFPVLEVLDEIPSDEWMFWEQWWIQVFKGYGFRLLNADNGGLGHHRITPEMARKISQTLTGRKIPEFYRTVSCYSKDGVFVKTFTSFIDAAKYVGGNHSNICRAIKHSRVAYEYLWRYGDSTANVETQYRDGKFQISEQTRALLSAASRGKKMPPVSDATRAKMRAAALKRWHGTTAADRAA